MTGDGLARRRPDPDAARPLTRAPNRQTFWFGATARPGLPPGVVPDHRNPEPRNWRRSRRPQGGRPAGREWWRYVATVLARVITSQLADVRAGGAINNSRAGRAAVCFLDGGTVCQWLIRFEMCKNALWPFMNS